MVMLQKKSVLLAKLETTYGTDPTPGSTDVVEAIDATIKESFEAVPREVRLKTLSNMASLAGAKFAEVTFKLEVKGSGSIALPPRMGPILQACGLAVTIQSGVSVTYAPTSSSFSSVTLYLYKDGRRHIVTGARGTAKLTGESGKQGILEISMKGLYTAPTATALPTVSYESTVPPICKNTTFSYNSKTTLIVSKFEFDEANEVVQRPSLSATYAIAGFEITGRKPVFSMDAESQVETSYTFDADALTTQRAVAYAIGATAGNICTVNVAKYNITEIERSDKDGIMIDSLKGECAVSAAATGDDEFSLVFT